HYSLREIQIALASYDLEELLKEEDELITHEMKVFFYDGREITVPIGEIVLRKPYEFGDALGQWGSSSGDNWNILTYRAYEALTIDSITFDFADVLQDQFFVKFDSTNTATLHEETHDILANTNWRDVPGIDIRDLKFPLELQEDEYITLYTQTSPNFFGSLQSSFLFTGSTENGKPFTSNSTFNSQLPNLNQEDVDRLIHERGASK
ncbi:hypothetical protein J4G37_39495, partial [Microvirga sp. 3-52]|nr:hypothetical protein [Microvirga sp. 3-52]